MWTKLFHILAPLASLFSKTAKRRWGDLNKWCYILLKRVAKEVLLSYLDFTKSFQMYMGASHLQLGVIITQDRKPIGYWSHKQNIMHMQYTTTVHKLLSMVEALKEFRNVLLGL
jgi:hypothetical protein